MSGDCRLCSVQCVLQVYFRCTSVRWNFGIYNNYHNLLMFSVNSCLHVHGSRKRTEKQGNQEKETLNVEEGHQVPLHLCYGRQNTYKEIVSY